MVGPLSEGPEGAPEVAVQHAGWPGIRISGSASPNHTEGLVQAAQLWGPFATKANAILLHIGTNDILQNEYSNSSVAAADMAAQLAVLLAQIYQLAPQATVYVASIISFAATEEYAAFNEQVAAFNELIPVVVKGYISGGGKARFVDMARRSSMTCNAPGYCCPAGIHPTVRGYSDMASVWQAALINHQFDPDHTREKETEFVSSLKTDDGSIGDRTWSGPSVRPDVRQSVAGLRVGSDDAPSVVASWLTLTPDNGIDSDGEDALAMAKQSARVGMQMIEFLVAGLPNRTSPMDTSTIVQWRRVVQAAGNATIILRVSLYDMVDEGVVLQSTRAEPGKNSGPCGGGPSSGSGACVSTVTTKRATHNVGFDTNRRSEATTQCSCQRMNTPASHGWVSYEQERLAAHLEYMDTVFPGAIGGVHLTSMHSGEFYYPGWDAVGHYDHMYGDYSEAARVSFCGNRSAATCTLPSAHARDTPVRLPGAGSNNVFVDGQAARANLQLSVNIADAVVAFCEAAKRVSGGKLLTIAFFGYLMGVSDWRVTGSGQLTASTIIDHPSIDAFAA